MLFYGRMLSLTYAAELMSFQHRSSNDLDFIQRYRQDKAFGRPISLQSLVAICSGLDGQTTKQSTASSKSGDSDKPSFSLEDLKHGGGSDQNKPVGESQFDYLTRLGDRIKALEGDWARKGRGRIDAIGIVGSDPYDTLSILQALRPSFPNTVFFTTDLQTRDSRIQFHNRIGSRNLYRPERLWFAVDELSCCKAAWPRSAPVRKPRNMPQRWLHLETQTCLP